MNSNTKILYVDDEVINLLLFKKHLSEYEVLTAPDGQKGLELLAEIPDISVVFSDMQMQKMDGIEFISKAKKRYPEKKYILLTCLGIIPEIQQALDSKLIMKYIREPINRGEIIEARNEMVKC